MMPLWFKSNPFIGAATAIAVSAVIYVAYDYWKSIEPASNWLRVDEIVVRDAQIGEDPRIVYRREILRDYPATFIASVFRFADKTDPIGKFYCSGQGGSNYKAGRKLPPSAITLSWLMNRESNPCIFTRGLYRLTISYTITPDGYPPKVFSVDSNYFLVPPASEISK